MVRSKKGGTGAKRQTKGRVKVGKLNLNKETVKNLTASEQKKLKGAVAARGTVNLQCNGTTLCTDVCRTL
jgi:hypothetical protein